MTRVELRAGASLAGVFGLRMLGLFFILPVLAVHAPQHRRRRRPDAGRHRARRLRPLAGNPADSVRHRVRPLGPQAGALRRAARLRRRQLSRLRRRRHLDHDRRAHAAGRRRDLFGGDGARRRPHARAAPHQGDGDDRLDDRPHVRAVAGRRAAALSRDRHGRLVRADRRAVPRRDRAWSSSRCPIRRRSRARRAGRRACAPRCSTPSCCA